MKRTAFIILVMFFISPIYGQINFNEKVNIYDIDSLNVEFIYDDFDNDNDIDIVKIGPPTSYVNVLLQKNENGNLNLILPKLISNSVKPIISLDLNNDDYPDLITYHSYSTIGVLYNLQNDTFSEEQTLINFSGSYSIAPIKFDYNSDGFIDLILRNNQDNAYVLINNQNGGFLPQQFLFGLGSFFTSIYKIEDFDDDGDFDLYIIQNNSLKIYLNNNGNFINPNLLTVEAIPFKEFGLLDIDGNGFKDILYWKNGAIWAKYFGFNATTNQFIVLNDLVAVQNITFNNSTNNSRSIHVKRISPGVFDVYVALESAPHQSNIHKFNINNGLFSSSTIVLPNFDINIFNLINFKFIDLNNNGNVDFLFSSNFNSQNMLLLNNNIDNSIDKTICIQQTINTSKFNVIDMNGDGIEDICLGGQNGLGYYEKINNNNYRNIKNLIGVMSNPNASTFTLNNIMNIDNDNLGDVIDYSESDSYAKVFKNLGNDNFLFVQNISIPILTSGIFFVDIDNDGFKDMVFRKNQGITGNALMWSRNNDGVNFEVIQPIIINYINPLNIISLAFDDFNNNGYQDILLLSSYYANDLFNYEIILLENQNGIFSATSIATLIDSYSGGNIKIKDIDQDGDLDFFVFNITAKPFLFFKNNGQNNFTKIIIENINVDDLEFDDNDGDGKFEIYATNYNSSLYLSKIFYYSTSNFLNFTKFEIDSFGTNYDTRSDLLLFDYNGDNKKDLFINNPSFLQGLVSVYLNSSNTLAIEETASDNNLKIFPNPFINFINWNGENNKNYKLQLFSLNGKLIHEEKISNSKIDFSFLESGTFLLVIEDIDLHSKTTYKIIKK